MTSFTEKIITNNLDIWTSSIKAKMSSGKGSNKKIELYGIKKLRELILNLAISGKLLPQDPCDKNAGELLKQIACEKAKLINGKKIKKQNSLPVIKVKEEPFPLPESWEWERMGNLTTKITDGTHHTPHYMKDGVPFISVKDIDGKCISFKECKYISEKQHAEINSRCNPQIGDILICRIGTLGRATIVDTDRPFSLFVSVGLIKFFQDLYIPRFAHLVLHSPLLTDQYQEIKAGGSHTNKLNLRDLPKLILPVAPLAEQHRIVAKVDTLMELCDQFEQVQLKNIETHNMLVTSLLKPLISATADPTLIKEAWINIQKNFNTLFISESSINRLKKVILQLAVMGKLVKQNIEDKKNFSSILDKEFIPSSEIIVPFEVPYKWDWRQLKELAHVNGGFAFSSGNFVKDGTRVIRISDFDEGGFKKNRIVRHEISDELEKYKLKEGDILLAMTGGTVGKSFHVESIDEPMLVNQRVATIRAGRSITSEYLNIVIKSELTQDVIFKSKNSTNDNISMKDINSFLVPLPPIAEQHRIVSKVNQLLLICDQIQSLLVKAQSTQINFVNTLVAGNTS